MEEKYSFEANYRYDAVDFAAPFTYECDGKVDEHIQKIMASRHLSSVECRPKSIILKAFSDAIGEAIACAADGQGRGSWYVEPYEVNIVSEDDHDRVICDTFTIVSKTELTFAEVRSIFHKIDEDEVLSMLDDLTTENVIDALKSLAPKPSTKASASTSVATVPDASASGHDGVANAPSTSATVPDASSSVVDETEPESASIEEPDSLAGITGEMLYEKFYLALQIETIRTAVRNTWRREGNKIILDSIEFEDKDADGNVISEQRTIVRYSTSRHTTISTTEYTQGEKPIRYDWRDIASYQYALDNLDEDGNIPQTVLSDTLIATSCAKHGVAFNPVVKVKPPKHNPYCDESCAPELWHVTEDDNTDTWYYICDTSQEKSRVIVIRDGAVIDDDTAKVDGESPKGKKQGIRTMLKGLEWSLLWDADRTIPREVLALLMSMGIAPRPADVITTDDTIEEPITPTTPVTMDTTTTTPDGCASAPTPSATVPDASPSGSAPVGSGSADAPSTDPLAAMMAQMAVLQQQIAAERKRQAEEAERKAREEAERKKREEEARREADRIAAERKAESERKAAEEQRKLQERIAEMNRQREIKERAAEVAKATGTTVGHTTDPIVVIDTTNEDGAVKSTIRCAQFDEILEWVRHGHIVCLWGPAGSGKDITCMQIAEALGVKYYSHNCVLNPFDVTGFIDGYGNYHDSEFYRAWTEGGVIAFTEIFASDPQVLNILNEALSNGYMIFGNKRIRKHPQCYVMASDNTTGTGATSNYSGRQRIDEATINRFVLIEVGYDHNVELEIANGNPEIVAFAEEVRTALCATGTDYVRSYRQTKQFTDSITWSCKFQPAAPYIKSWTEQCIHRCFHRYMDDSDFKLIASKFTLNKNPYVRAWRDMADAI